MDLGGFLNALGAATGWVVAHSLLVIGALVAAIILAYLVSGRGTR
jgi:hypothetical protein